MGPRKRITSAPIFSNREPFPHRFRLRRYGLGGRSRFNHFKKFARRANFLKWCRGGVWGGEAPLRNLRYPCLAPVPCPQFFFVHLFSSKFFRPNFFVGIFSSEFFRPNFFVGIFSSEFFSSDFFVRRRSVRPSSVRRPSVGSRSLTY